MTSKWPTMKLSEICTLTMGRTPARADKSLWDVEKSGKNVWVSIADLPLKPMTKIATSKEFISDEAAVKFPAVPPGTLLMSFKLSIGRTAISGCSLRTNEAIMAFTDLNEEIVDIRFLGLYLSHFNWSRHTEGEDKLLGSTMNKAKLVEFKIPIPPLDEQKRIVAKLDEALSDLDKVTEASKIALDQIDALWQAELVDMLDVEHLGLTAFKRERCVEVFNLIGGGTPSKANGDFWTGDIPWASIRDLKSRRLDRTEFSITEKGLKSSASNLIPAGNVVIATRVGLGKVVQLSQDTAINQDLRALVPKDPNRLMPDFIYYWYLINASKVIAAGTGATVQGVKLETIENLEIPMISIDEQKQVVSKLDNLKAHIDGLRETKLEKIEDANALRSSILAAAFAGDF